MVSPAASGGLNRSPPRSMRCVGSKGLLELKPVERIDRFRGTRRRAGLNPSQIASSADERIAKAAICWRIFVRGGWRVVLLT